jgi:hypothetical protein
MCATGKDKPTYTNREKKVIAAISVAVVAQRGKSAAEVQAAAAEALSTTLNKPGNSQGKPREVGNAGHGAKKAGAAKAKAKKDKKAEESDDEDSDAESDSD